MASPRNKARRINLDRVSAWLLLGLVVGLFLPAWIWHIRRTMDPFTFNDDARILIWPFFRNTDPSLFPHDPYVAYYLAGLPEGFLALYRTVGRLGWVRPTSEVLQYLSVLSVVALLAATARRVGGTVAAFLAAVLVLGSDSFFDRAGGGLPRAFAFPLVTAGLYALVTARPILLASLAVAGAAFYPVVAALLGASLAVLLILPDGRLKFWAAAPRETAVAGGNARTTTELGITWPWRNRALLLAVTLLGIVALLVPMMFRLQAYGEPITPAMLPDFPEAALGGRLSREHHPPFESIATVFARHARGAILGAGKPIGFLLATWLRRNDQRTSWIVLLVLGVAAARMIAECRRRPALARLWILPFVACVLHPMACLLAPRLFLPERYAQFAVPPFVVLLVAVGFGTMASRASLRPRYGRQHWHWASAALLLVALGGRGSSWVGIEVHVPPQERAFYAAMAQLPRDVVIAGWPAGPTENIPYLAERRVLTNFQLEMPFHTQFTLESRARLRAFFDAYFATTRGPIERLCSEYHVTHLVINSMHFARQVPDYYEPHRTEIGRLHRAAQGKFALPTQLLRHPSVQHFDFGLSLVDLSQIPELAAACSARRAS